MKGDPAAAECPANITDASIGIVVSDWHSEITQVLLDNAIQALKECGVERDDVYVAHVPGAMELPFGARQMAIVQEPSAVIVLGCIVREGNPLYDSIERSVTSGITNLNLHSDIPYLFGVLTTESEDQAKQYAAEMGTETAKSAIRMVNMMASLVNS